MKRIITKVTIFAVFLVIIDILVGIGCRYLAVRAKGGDTKQFNYIAREINDSIVVFGSSKASHHYVPQILEDSLGATVYNAGRDGNGIIFAYGQYLVMREHHRPKTIIYDVIPAFDIYEDENTKYLNLLRQFYDYPGVDSIFISVDPSERWKMMSQMRRYNKQFLQMASDFIKPQHSDLKGYRPLDGAIEHTPKAEDTITPAPDELKLFYVNKLIQQCKADSVELIFTVSPHYWALDRAKFAPVESLAVEYDIPFLYHADYFLESNDMFVDAAHMNHLGAEAYSRFIANKIKAESVRSSR